MAGCRRTIAELWSSLRRILCTPCNGAQARRIKIPPQRDRHGEPPSFATLESDSRRSGNPPASHALRDLVLQLRDPLKSPFEDQDVLRPDGIVGTHTIAPPNPEIGLAAER